MSQTRSRLPQFDSDQQQMSRHLPQLAMAQNECLSPAPDKQGVLSFTLPIICVLKCYNLILK